jgi:hypothetical protein
VVAGVAQTVVKVLEAPFRHTLTMKPKPGVSETNLVVFQCNCDCDVFRALLIFFQFPSVLLSFDDVRNWIVCS